MSTVTINHAVEEEKKEETAPQTSETEEAAFADKVFTAVLGAQLTQAAYIGHKLGWYETLGRLDPKA